MRPPMACYKQMPSNALEDRADDLLARLESCQICPRNCGVNRLENEIGFCRVGRKAKVYSYTPHFGEEAPLVGVHGSGTIFFSGCNMGCVFCQNYDISQMSQGQEVEAKVLADMMIHLQDRGCHNINFVTPTHIVPQILEALVLARDKGLSVPLVYNSSGYDFVDTLKRLDGIFDIYMPDAKYGSDEMAMKYSKAPKYTHYMKTSIKEMHHQAGDLQIEDDMAIRGLLVRHLILPSDLAGTAEIVRFLAEEISKDTYLNIMAQYHPEYNACSYPELDRRITMKEYRDSVKLAVEAGLIRGLAIF
ncbi:MAG: radical SAM protein [Methanotrichaceae archaeon]|nr:radical SAM protein [Methanotrichaceae archaeon]